MSPIREFTELKTEWKRMVFTWLYADSEFVPNNINQTRRVSFTSLGSQNHKKGFYMAQNELNIIVCIKAVVMKSSNGRLSRSEEACELNPFDRSALECGFRLRSEFGGRIDVLSMGPIAVMGVMREALALGADRAILLNDPHLVGSDTLATAMALAAAIRCLPSADLILFGARSADSDTGQVGPETAQLLDLPFLSGVQLIEPTSDGIRVKRRIDHFSEIYETDFPAALAIDPQSFRSRDVGLFGITAAFEDLEVDVWSLEELDIDQCVVGRKGSSTCVLSLEPAPKKSGCKMLSGEPAEQVDKVVEQLNTLGVIG